MKQNRDTSILDTSIDSKFQCYVSMQAYYNYALHDDNGCSVASDKHGSTMNKAMR